MPFASWITTLSAIGAAFAVATAFAIVQAFAGEVQLPRPAAEGRAKRVSVAAWADVTNPARRQTPAMAVMLRKRPKPRRGALRILPATRPSS
jgi:hypothetical protein